MSPRSCALALREVAVGNLVEGFSKCRKKVKSHQDKTQGELTLEQLSAACLVPGTGFMEDSFQGRIGKDRRGAQAVTWLPCQLLTFCWAAWFPTGHGPILILGRGALALDLPIALLEHELPMFS